MTRSLSARAAIVSIVIFMTFMLAWHFPNRVAWRSEEYGAMHFGEYTDTIIGNEYTTRYRDAWDHACDRTQHGKPIELSPEDSH